MKRRRLIQWFIQSGFEVRIANGLVRIERGDDLLYLQNQWYYYPKWYLRVIFFVYCEMWEGIHWKTAYQQCINSSPLKSNNYENKEK